MSGYNQNTLAEQIAEQHKVSPEGLELHISFLLKRQSQAQTAGTPAADSHKPSQLLQPVMSDPQSVLEAGKSEPIWGMPLANVLQKSAAAAASALASSSPQRSRIAYIDEADSLAKFSGHDELLPVKTWTKNVEELATISGWNEHETYFASKRALTGAAADWILTRSDLQS